MWWLTTGRVEYEALLVKQVLNPFLKPLKTVSRFLAHLYTPSINRGVNEKVMSYFIQYPENYLMIMENHKSIDSRLITPLLPLVSW